MSSTTQPPTAKSQTPSSSLSISPQTPFFPTSTLSLPVAQNATLATSPTNKSFLKYAAALSKSPTSQQPSILTQRGFHPDPLDHDHDHPEHHDSFEFGDYGDLKSKSWTAGVNRRAASISGPVPVPGQAQGQGLGITSGLASGLKDVGAAGGIAQGQGGVMADKVAKGQGVLRRLSLSGGSFTRPSFLSPPLGTNVALPTSPNETLPQPDSQGGGLQRSSSVSVPGPSAGALRGRRLSETSKKRGVSPMGERLLRDHGHF